jgi:hypothetical protein
MDQPVRFLIAGLLLDLRDRCHSRPPVREQIRLTAHQLNEHERGYAARNRHRRRRPARLRPRRVTIEPALRGFRREVPDRDRLTHRVALTFGAAQRGCASQLVSARRIPIVRSNTVVIVVAAFLQTDDVAGRDDAL